MKITFGKLESLFAFMIIIFGILIIYLTPPMCSPDENIHFIDAYAVSNGEWFPSVEDGRLGRWLPNCVYNFVVDNTKKVDREDGNKYTWKEMDSNNSCVTDKGAEKLFYVSASTAISPISYFVASTGMLLFKGFCAVFASGYASPYNLLIIGKLSNLLFYGIVIWYALKMTPYYKNIMFMIALMPMSIFLGASLNYDSILIAVTLYFFAFLMKILHADDKYQVTKKDIVRVCFITFCLVGIKQLYAPLLALLLIVPVKKFKDNKQYFTAISAVIITGVIAYLPNLILHISTSEYISPYIQYEIEQKQYVVHNIFNFLKIVLTTFKESMPYFITSFIGCLGNLDTNFMFPFILIFGIILCFVAFFDVSRIKRTDIKLRIGSVVLIGVIIIIASYVMYVGWTSIPEIAGVGYPIVSGLQGRYFIPLFMFGIAVFSNNVLYRINFIENHLRIWEKRVDYLTKMTMIIMDILTIVILLLRFYI